jgi:hypothetical protein
MKLTTGEERPEAPTPTMILFEAIIRRRCIAATYNRQRMVLAPHILYTRNGALYIDAVTVAREGMQPREIKLATFKLDGLSELRVVEREFSYNADLFEPAAEKYEGVTVLAAEPETAAA